MKLVRLSDLYTLELCRLGPCRIGQEVESRQSIPPLSPVPAGSRLSLGPNTPSRKKQQITETLISQLNDFFLGVVQRLAKLQKLRLYFPQREKDKMMVMTKSRASLSSACFLTHLLMKRRKFSSWIFLRTKHCLIIQYIFTMVVFSMGKF